VAVIYGRYGKYVFDSGSPGPGVRVSVIECFEFLESEDGYKGCRSCRVDGGTCVRQLNIWNASG
jgi:hypothetical protein